MSTLQNKTLFITGASRGIGLAIALRAAREGANIVVVAKTAEPDPRLPGTIFSAAAEIEAAGGRALPLQVDIRDDQAVQDAVNKAVETFGGIDICINNASALFLRGTLDTPMKRYDLMHQINTRGTFLVSQTCLPHLLKASNPHILNLSPPLNLSPANPRSWPTPPGTSSPSPTPTAPATSSSTTRSSSRPASPTSTSTLSCLAPSWPPTSSSNRDPP
jgi:citronellol/citronellal dehydrogenase